MVVWVLDARVNIPAKLLDVCDMDTIPFAPISQSEDPQIPNSKFPLTVCLIRVSYMKGTAIEFVKFEYALEVEPRNCMNVPAPYAPDEYDELP